MSKFYFTTVAPNLSKNDKPFLLNHVCSAFNHNDEMEKKKKMPERTPNYFVHLTF